MEQSAHEVNKHKLNNNLRANSVHGTKPAGEELILYANDGSVRARKKIDPDLRRMIDILEDMVLAKIGHGIFRPLLRGGKNQSKQYYIERNKRVESLRKADLRRKCSEMPLPEARAIIWFFLHYHPSANKSHSELARIYQWDHSSIISGVGNISHGVRQGKNLGVMQEFADGLAAQGLEEWNVASVMSVPEHLPRKHFRWTEEKEKRLVALYKAGTSRAWMAKKLGASPKAITSKLVRLRENDPSIAPSEKEREKRLQLRSFK